MNKILDTLSSYTAHVMISTQVHEDGFRLSVGLLGKTFTTSPELTQQILDSPEYDQLFGNERAIRIMEMILARAQQ